jgi:hypothetical protein
MVKKKKIELFQEFRSNEKSAYTTIKTTLKSVLRNHTEVQPVITNLVFEMNDLMIHSYQFIRLYVLKCYNNRQQFPEINEKFILYCIKALGEKTNSGRKEKDTSILETLQEFYDTEYQPLLNHQKTQLKNKSNMLPYLATQLHTSLSNNTQERFIQHFLRFINKTTTKITEDKATLFKFKKQLLDCNEETEPMFDDWKRTHLQNILPKNIKKSVHYDVKVSPFDYLKGMLYMNAVLEKEEHKLFQPLPLRNNIIPKHIILDTASIVNLFSLEGKTKTELFKAIKENQHDVWNNLLNLQHKTFKSKHYQFHYQIQTDGISCSLLFIRKDLKDKKWGSKVPILQEQEFHNIEDLSLEQLDTLKDRNIVGCDPGKHSLVYMMDKQGNKLQYTASQRKIESYGKRNERILLQEKKRNNIIEKETHLLSKNSKSVDYEKFKVFLVEKDKLNKETTEFYKRDVWRKMKFRQYSYGKKSIDTFLNKIKKTFGDNILIGYGNWSRSTQMKHMMPTMNKGLRKLIHKKYDTLTINEFYTSQKCCECYKDLKHHINKKVKYRKDTRGKEIYRLFCCSNCVSSKNKNGVFRTRDKNSAISIMKLTKEWIETQTRPSEFCFQHPPTPCIASVKAGNEIRQS